MGSISLFLRWSVQPPENPLEERLSSNPLVFPLHSPVGEQQVWCQPGLGSASSSVLRRAAHSPRSQPGDLECLSEGNARALSSSNPHQDRALPHFVPGNDVAGICTQLA